MLTTKEKFSLTPRNLEEAMSFAKIIAESDMVPVCYKNKPANVLVAVQMGQSVGLQPMQALQNIAVINGRPCVWGDAMLALINASGELDNIEEIVTETKAVCSVWRKGRSVVVREFTMEDANKAGLTSRPQSPWKTYPKRMLQMRARGFALRDCFPDILAGLNLAEEVKDLELTQETQKQPESKATSSLTLLKNKLNELPAIEVAPSPVTQENKPLSSSNDQKLQELLNKANTEGITEDERYDLKELIASYHSEKSS